MKENGIAEVDYEKGYHAERHPNHINPQYFEARADIALTKFFKGVDLNQKILDYGCGMGQNIYKVPGAVGYDISEYALEHCRSKGMNVTNHLEDLEDEGFDVVFSSHVLEHHPHPKTMLEEMRSKLKTGKELILVIPFEKHGKGSFELDLDQHLYNWNFQNINNLLITVGFKIKENKYIRGAGYHKFLPLYKKSFGLYKASTLLASRLFGIKEMMIKATKI
ncbi:MAG: class I SAM-dependent methyltransferase [Bacteroidota bacterium]